MSFHSSRLILMALALLLAPASAPSQVERLPIPAVSALSPAAAAFCVETFNTYGPAYAFGLEERTAAAVKALAESGACPFVLLQEVWDDDHYRNLKSLVDRVKLGYQGVRFDWTRRGGQGFMSGLAALVKTPPLRVLVDDYPVNYSGALDWIRSQFGVVKSIGILDVRLPGVDLPATLVNTHLHPVSHEIRLAQIIHLADLLLARGASEKPLILGGDFNSTPDSLEYALLSALLLLKDSMVRYDPGACTYCADNPLIWGKGGRVLDYLFYRDAPGLELSRKSASVVMKGQDDLHPSDHYGVRASFEVKKVEPELLGVNDPVFLERVKRAKETLARVKKILVATEDAMFAPSIAAVDRYQKALEKLEPEGALVAYFRVK